MSHNVTHAQPRNILSPLSPPPLILSVLFKPPPFRLVVSHQRLVSAVDLDLAVGQGGVGGEFEHRCKDLSFRNLSSTPAVA